MVAAGIATAGDITRVEDRVVLVILTVAWVASAVRRVSDFRQGRCRAVRIDRSDRVSMGLLLAFGTAPWFALEVLRNGYPDSVLWTRLEVSPGFTVIGIIAAVTTVGWPMIRGESESA